MRLSVIIPVYKVEQYLNQCVESVLSQTFTDFEVLLIDDGSPDRSGEMCDEWALKDNRIRVIHQKNEGLSGARNTGLKYSRGDYVTFVDSDDLIDSTMAEIMMSRIDKDNLDAVWCSHYRFFNDDIGTKKARNIPDLLCVTPERIKEKMIMNIITGFDHSVEIPVMMWSVIYKKSIIEENRLIVSPVKQTSSEDSYFNLQFLSKCSRARWMNVPLYYYRRNPASLSMTIKDYTVPSIINYERILYNLCGELHLDKERVRQRIKIRTMTSLSPIFKLVIDFNSYKDSKRIIKQYIKDNNIRFELTKYDRKKAQFQVALFHQLLKYKLYLPLYLLVKIYSRFIVR